MTTSRLSPHSQRKTDAERYLESQPTDVYGQARLSGLSDLLEHALQRSMQMERHTGKLDDDISAALSQICFQAVNAGLRAEQLVILIKKTWMELPETHQGDVTDEDEIKARIITACIRGYYSVRGVSTFNEGRSQEIGVRLN